MLLKKMASPVSLQINMNKLSLIHWHIEPSSICTLKCPRCPRIEVPESLLNRQLSLDFFQSQIGEEVIKEMRKITFCGNDGDPIYCNDLVSIISWIKSINSTINIVLITNGSHKKEDWWISLASVMNEYDEIHWSVDGWDQVSNNKYRVNSNWDSIVLGINTFNTYNKNKTFKVWASIAFKFNEDKIQVLNELASENNFDCFQLTLSTKFGSKYPETYTDSDELEPSSKFIPTGHRFERKNTLLSNKKRYSDEIKDMYKQISNRLTDRRLCFIGNKGVFLNSHGEFYPCCWVANRYEHNKVWTELGKSRFNLHNRTFTEIIKDEYWENEFLKFDNLECKTKCNVETLKVKNYLLEW